MEIDLKQLLESWIVDHLNPRDAFFGGRINAVHLHVAIYMIRS